MKQVGRSEVDVQKKVDVHAVSDGPAKGWVHTHGLDKYGEPELEIRNVPMLFTGFACQILNHIADYMLNHATKPILPGQKMEINRVTIIVFHETSADDKAGYDDNHYKVKRLRVDSIDTTGRCACCDPKARA